MKSLYVDLDGVLHQFDKGWTGEAMQQKPVKGAIEAVNLLIKHGYEVVVFTTRENTQEVKYWLDKHGFPKLQITNKKGVALAYIDDRGIRFTNWQDILKYFL